MSALSLVSDLPACSPEDLDETMRMRDVVAKMPQYDFPTEYFFHGGMYVRTVKMPASSILCGAVIKVPTLVTVAGDCIVTCKSSKDHSKPRNEADTSLKSPV